MEFIAITEHGRPERSIDATPGIAAEVMHGTAAMYAVSGYRPPWIGYLARLQGECVGTCAFKAPPSAGRVEIAYFTFPGHEGKGVATEMARRLMQIAWTEEPTAILCAQTLPERSASTRVLEKLGFHLAAERMHPEDGRVWHWERSAPVPDPAGALPSR